VVCILHEADAGDLLEVDIHVEAIQHPVVAVDVKDRHGALRFDDRHGAGAGGAPEHDGLGGRAVVHGFVVPLFVYSRQHASDLPGTERAQRHAYRPPRGADAAPGVRVVARRRDVAVAAALDAAREAYVGEAAGPRDHARAGARLPSGHGGQEKS
jgi:hypothetical protein